MLTDHPYPFRYPTADEIAALERRARVERARVARSLFLALFGRRAPAPDAEIGPSLPAAHPAR
jgi:hypothetical protein